MEKSIQPNLLIDLPDFEGRVKAFNFNLQGIKTDEDKPNLAKRLAALTPGFSGADIANVCNESALIGARDGAASVTLAHFEAAMESIRAGLEKKSSDYDMGQNPKGRSINFNVSSLLVFLEQSMDDQTKFHCVPHIIRPEGRAIPLCGRDDAL